VPVACRRTTSRSACPGTTAAGAGSVCARPLENTSCLILPRIGEDKRDEIEARYAGQRLDELSAGDLPPYAGERVSFMAPFELTRTMRHPYAETSTETHGHFAPTRFVQPLYSAACVPIRWMLRGQVEGDPRNSKPGLAERLKLGWTLDREPTRVGGRRTSNRGYS